jgi:hypothetical protein
MPDTATDAPHERPLRRRVSMSDCVPVDADDGAVLAASGCTGAVNATPQFTHEHLAGC